jgi:preprotein translocase subunit SecF
MKKGKTKTSGDVNRFQFRSVFLRLIVETTALMFLPSLVLFGVGMLVDFVWQTTPIGMLAGVIIGFAVSVVLVSRLIHQIQERQK